MLGERLISSGHEVWGLRRSSPALNELEKKNIKPVKADLSTPETLKYLPLVDQVVLCQAPSGKGDDYRTTYCEGTQNILNALSENMPDKLIFISSTSVYSAKDGRWVDEKTDPRAGGIAAEEANLLLKAEELALESAPSIVFRLGGIYGPGRNRLEALKTGRLKPSFSDAFVNRIHAEDAAAGIELLLKKGRIGEIYLGVDDDPCTQKEFYEWICEKLPIPKIEDGPVKNIERISNKRCSNRKIKELGLKLKYPTFREGYESLMEEVRS